MARVLACLLLVQLLVQCVLLFVFARVVWSGTAARPLHVQRCQPSHGMKPRPPTMSNSIAPAERIEHCLGAAALATAVDKSRDLTPLWVYQSYAPPAFYARDWQDLSNKYNISANTLVSFHPGDVNFNTDYVTFAKSRPIGNHKKLSNIVLMPLNTARHTLHARQIIDDGDVSYESKKEGLVWRGATTGPPDEWGTVSQSRLRFVERFYRATDWADVGFVAPFVQSFTELPSEYAKPKLLLKDLLKYKVIVSLEGNDVASNLRWAMASNSVVMMPAPTSETWFLESKLLPFVHYVPIMPSFDDVQTKYRWIMENPKQACWIASNATAFVRNFLDEAFQATVVETVFKTAARKMNGFAIGGYGNPRRLAEMGGKMPPPPGLVPGNRERLSLSMGLATWRIRFLSIYKKCEDLIYFLKI
jgi:hypothetical protein